MALCVEDRLCEKVLRFAMVEERRNEANKEKPADGDKPTSVPTKIPNVPYGIPTTCSRLRSSN